MFSCRYLELFEYNNVVGYWAYIWRTYIRGAYIWRGAYIRGGAYIWNEVSVSTCGGPIHGGGGLIFGGGLIVGVLRYTSEQTSRQFQLMPFVRNYWRDSIRHSSVVYSIRGLQ